MELYLQFPQGWWPLLLIIFAPFLVLFFLRRGYEKPKEIKAQIVWVVVATALAFVIEFVAVSLEVWTYFPGNWPIILWLGYIGAALSAFQIIKKIEEL